MLHDAVLSKDEAPASFRRMLTTIRSLVHTIRRLRVDNDTVFLGAAFRNILDEFNIAVETQRLTRIVNMAGLSDSGEHWSRWRSQ
jgi:hypothetical protein